MIKESGYKGTIIVTESSMSWCLRNGITPHLAVTVDPHHDRIVRWFGDPTLTAEKIAADDYFSRQDMDPHFRDNQLKSNQELLDLVNTHGHKVRLAAASSASPSVVDRAQEAGIPLYWWNPFYDDYDAPDSLTRQIYAMNRKPCINAGGNVGTACWVMAHAVLGKSKVGLLGMDFSYYGDTTYRQTQYYYELQDLVGEDRLSEAFIHMNNPYTGTDFFTDPPYYWYRSAFLEMAESAAAEGVKTFNCSGGGMLFGPGIDFVSFDKFVESTRA